MNEQAGMTGDRALLSLPYLVEKQQFRHTMKENI